MTKGKSTIEGSPEIRRSLNKRLEKRIAAGDAHSPSLELIEEDSSEWEEEEEICTLIIVPSLA